MYDDSLERGRRMSVVNDFFKNEVPPLEKFDLNQLKPKEREAYSNKEKDSDKLINELCCRMSMILEMYWDEGREIKVTDLDSLLLDIEKYKEKYNV